MTDNANGQFGSGSAEPGTEAVVEKIRNWVEDHKAEWQEVEWKDFVLGLYEDGCAAGMSLRELEDIRDSEKEAWLRAEEARRNEEAKIAEENLTAAKDAECRWKVAEQARKRRQEEQLFEEIRSSPTIGLCKRYLMQYPKGRHSRKVNKALERLQDRRWYYLKLIAKVTILCIIVIAFSSLIIVQLIKSGEKQAQITRLLTEAQANDSREKGKVALDALAKLFQIDPKHVKARRLYRKISAYYIPGDPYWWFNKAKTTAAEISNFKERAVTYRAIVEAQVQAGDVASARETFKALEATAKRIKNTESTTADKDSGYMQLGMAHTTAGNITEALAIASRINPSELKYRIYNAVIDIRLKEHDFAGARVTADLVTSDKEKMYAYSKIVLAQVKEEDITGAKATATAADSYSSVWRRTYGWEAYACIMNAEIEAGNLAAAEETLKLMKHGYHNYSNSVQCARIEAVIKAKQGNTASARAAFKNVWDLVADSHYIFYIDKAEAYCRVAESVYDTLGDEVLTCQFLKKARSSQGRYPPRSRVQRYIHIATIEAKMGNVSAAKESLATARKIVANCRKDRREKAELYLLIAKAQAKAGDIKEAKATAAKIPRSRGRYLAHLAIARKQEEMGDIVAAKKSLWQAKAAAGRGQKDFAYLAIAKEQARTGDITGAKTTAAGISQAKGKSNAYIYIASAQVEAGDIVGAKALVEYMKAYWYYETVTSVYEKFAKVQAKTGDLVGLYDWINDISNPALRTFAYLGAGKGLIEETARQ